jgi:DNA polymerase elongation subunit (family B)
MKYEWAGDKGSINAMGMVLKRRDNAPIVKLIVGGMINQILTHGDRQAAVDHVMDILKGITSNKYDMSNFVITKSLKSGYKNPGSLSHVVLADRIGRRDPGKKPTVGDRMMYLAIESKTGREKDKLGERVETPEYIVEHGLTVDYAYYIEKQIQTPVVQILELILNKKQVTKMISQFMGIIKNRRYGINSLGGCALYRPIVGVRAVCDKRLLTAADLEGRF